MSAQAATAGELRAFWRGVQDPPSIWRRLEPAYLVFITLAIFGPIVYGTVSQALADVATPRALAEWAPALALAALLGLTRWGAVQGPVVFSVADVAWLLGAPLRRADLVLGRLVRALAVGAGAGAVLGALVLIGAAGDHRGIAVARGAGFVLGSTLLVVLGVAAAALVQGSARIDTLTRRAVWPLLVFGAALVILASDGGRTGAHVALWCGPWGWAIQPLLGLARVWPLALVLLAAATVVAVTIAIARRGATPTERHLVRAEARSGAVAAIYSMNARFVRRSLTDASARPGGAPRTPTLRPPRNPRLVIPWRDAGALLRTPGRLAQGLLLATGGTAIALINGAHPAAVIAGGFITFFAASRVLEPLRAETDQPGRVRVLLRAPMGRVLAGHAVVPVLVVLTGALIATAGAAVAGALPDHARDAVPLALLATPAITLAAALSSRRGGQLPPSIVATATVDQTGSSLALVFFWVLAYPALAAVIEVVAISIVVQNGGGGGPQITVGLIVASVVQALALGAKQFAPD